MKKSEAMRSYKWAISMAAKYRLGGSAFNDLYGYYRGAASAYGEALEYGFDRINADIQAAIAEAQTQKAV